MQGRAVPSARRQRGDDDVAGPGRAPAGPGRLLALQRAAGNRAVSAALGATGAVPVVQRDYELRTSGGGVYESEQFGDAAGTRERVSYVEIPVAVAGTGDRTAAPPPLSQFVDGGKTTAPGTERKAGYDGGHVVGLQLGGKDIPENVVPMLRAFNRGVYKNAEDAVRKASAGVTGGGQPWLVVYCHYADDEADTPYAFELILTSRGAQGETKVASHFLRQPEDIVRVPVPALDRQQLLSGGGTIRQEAVTGAAAAGLDDKHFDLPQGTTAAQYIATTGHLPRSSRSAYPDDPANRPYELLDLLTLSGALDHGTGMSTNREFSGAQRRLVLEANLTRNAGVLRSDDPQDPVFANPELGGELSEWGDVNFPEVDHIIPNSSGGGNFFSNARLVSWDLNNRLDRVKSVHHLVDPRRRPLPTLTTTDSKGLAILAVEYVAREAPPGASFTAGDVWAWAGKTFDAFRNARLTPTRLARVEKALTGLGTLVRAGATYTLAPVAADTSPATAPVDLG